MALSKNVVWEIRTDGNANNGGGFDSTIAGAGTDYSQQASPQLSLTDITTVSPFTTLTSVTGGFTAAMIGNVIHITSGTNFVAHYYVITGIVNAQTITVDRATALNTGSGGVGRVGGATNTVVSHPAVSGNIVYIRGGTYTVTGQTCTANSTSPDWIRYVGYDTIRGDKGRPIFDTTTVAFGFSAQYGSLENIELIGTGTAVLSIGGFASFTHIINCKITNSSVTPGRSGVLSSLSSGSMVILGGEFKSTVGYAIRTISTIQIAIIGAYIHDSNTGFSSGYYSYVFNCIFDSCTNGILSAGEGIYIGNTIYGGLLGGGNGLQIGSGSARILNNIFDSNVTGIRGVATSNHANFANYNNFFNNTTNRLNNNVGENDTAINPAFVDAPNADFRIGSSLKGLGWPNVFSGSNANNISYPDMGALQRQETSSSSTLSAFLFC